VQAGEADRRLVAAKLIASFGKQIYNTPFYRVALAERVSAFPELMLCLT
jgi:hypothetical protein